MAPMTVQNSHHLKRTASEARLSSPAAKKVNRGPSRLHKPVWDLQRKESHNASFQDEAAVQFLLTRSLGLALKAVGFEAAAPDALESFRLDVEEYMAHYLADVRQSMLSCRRTQPIPQDFLQALHTHQLSLRSLLPHLDPPVPPSSSQFSLESEPALDDEQLRSQFLGPVLTGAPDDRAKLYVPKHFPEFPSKHTYKATPEFPDRDDEPRKVRERATEESRLGEEALRRLVSTSSSHPVQPKQQQQGKNTRALRDQMWMETMTAVTKGEPEEMDHDYSMSSSGKGKQKEGDPTGISFRNARIGFAVNADKKYWRKAAPQRREGNAST